VGAVLNVAAFDFFFVPPRFGFVPTDPQHYLTFAVMVAVGAFIGQLAGHLRFQARVASHRERRARTLYEFARDLAMLRTISQVIEKPRNSCRASSSRVAVLVPDATGMLVSPTGRGTATADTLRRSGLTTAQQAGAGTDTPRATSTCSFR
jgi:two-component system sensor histidine kinase KdpD